MPYLNIDNEVNIRYSIPNQKNININKERCKILNPKPTEYNNQTHEHFYPKNSLRKNFNNFNERISVGNNQNEINKFNKR